MTSKHERKARAAFGKPKRSLKPWEEEAEATARKTERLKALRLAKEAEDRAAAAGAVSKADDKAGN
jgi:hypothetical protein